MSVEQVAHDFIANMDSAEKTMASITPDAVISGGVLPAPLPASESIEMIKALKTAFPDIKFAIDRVTVNGDEATVMTTWTGTNTGALSLPMPGMPSIPPTGKKVSVKDAYVITVRGDKVSQMTVISPADGGLPAALAQLGIQMPGV